MVLPWKPSRIVSFFTLIFVSRLGFSFSRLAFLVITVYVEHSVVKFNHSISGYQMHQYLCLHAWFWFLYNKDENVYFGTYLIKYVMFQFIGLNTEFFRQSLHLTVVIFFFTRFFSFWLIVIVSKLLSLQFFSLPVFIVLVWVFSFPFYPGFRLVPPGMVEKTRAFFIW